MRVGILGPVRVTDDGCELHVAAAKERAVLAVLALHVGHPVTLDQLVESLWGEDPPPKAVDTLRTHVARLRRVLGDSVVATSPGGYALALGANDIDAVRLEHLVGDASNAVEAGDHGAAHALFAEAESLWRGEPLLDLADSPRQWGQVARLRELAGQARHGRISAALALGRHHSVIGELEELVAENPLREPYWELLVLALYRAGRQIDALRAVRRLREVLVDEGGLVPSHRIERLEWQVLNRDPQLDLAPPTPPTSLPEPIDSFVGRVAEISELPAAVRKYRLVTLHGPGGVGKSRLALEIARTMAVDFPDGVVWIDMARTADEDDVTRAVARALGVASVPDRPLSEVVSGRLRHQVMLLVLDNCEQAVRAVSTRAADLLSSAPGLHLLATSRVELGVKGEYRVTVDPLAVPATDSDPGEIATADAVDLYLQRHRVVIGRDAVDADLASIGELTRRLDGLPLAIELAAGRSQILTPAEISERLSEHPRVLGAPDTTAAREDHQTMSDTIRWSYDLLEPATAHVFDLLSVMPDAFGVETAEAVCGAGGLDHGTIVDHLAQLQQASMVTSEPTAEGQRFRILLLLRQFGADRLAERGETERARRAHADHFRQMARRAASEIDGPDASRWWARVTVERTHMRSAVEWSLQHDDRTTTLEFAHLLARTQELTVSVDCHEAVDLFTSMLDGADAAPADHRGWAWLGIVTPAFLTGDSALAVEAATTSLALFDESADAGGRAMAHFDLAMALLLAIGDTAQAAELNATAAAEAHAAGSRAAEAWAISGQAQSMLFGNAPLEEIEPLLVRSEGLTDEGLPVLRAHNALNRAYFSYVAGDLERAATATRQARDDAARGGSPMLEQAGLLGVAAVALLGGDAERARAELLRAVQIAIDGSNTLQLGAASLALAGTLDTLGDLTAAARMWGAGTARSPVWPFIAERWFPHGARKTLGDRFQREVEIGTELTERQILDLAIG